MTFEPELASGDTGEHVTLLQERLERLGFYEGRVDGELGPATEDAVLRFQESASEVADGQVGSRTWEALERQEQNLVEPAAAEQPTEVVWSEDGQYWWDGTAWQAASGGTPEEVSVAEPEPVADSSIGQLSPDGQWRWDGTSWQAVLATPDAALVGLDLEHRGNEERAEERAAKPKPKAQTKEEARLAVRGDIDPKDCFIELKNTKEGWGPIDGTGCAHWVAHQRKGLEGTVHVCEKGFLYRVDDAIARLTRVSEDLSGAVVGAVWKKPTGSHIGLVEQVNRNAQGKVVSVAVRNDSSEEGGVVLQVKLDGSIYN